MQEELESKNIESEESIPSSMPVDLFKVLEDGLGKDKAITINSIYESIGSAVDSEFFKLNYSLSELDEKIVAILNNQDQTENDMLVSIDGLFLREAKNVLNTLGVTLVDLEDINSGIAGDILRIIVLLPELELGLESEVLKVCDSTENKNNLVLDFSRLLESYGRYSTFEYFDSIEDVSQDFLNRLRKELDDKVYEPDEHESMDLLKLCTDLSFKFKIMEPYSSIDGEGPLVSRLEKEFINIFIEKKLSLQPLDKIVPIVINYLNVNTPTFYEPYITFTIIASKEGQMLTRDYDIIDLINKYEIMDVFRDNIRSVIVSENKTPDTNAIKLEAQVESALNSIKQNIAKQIIMLRRM